MNYIDVTNFKSYTTHLHIFLPTCRINQVKKWACDLFMPMISNTDIICFQTCIKGTVFLDFFTTYHLWRLMKKDVMFYCHIFIYWVYQMYRTAKWQLQLYRLLLHSPSKFRNCLTKCTGWVFCRKTKNKSKDSFICFHISHPNESPNIFPVLIPDFHIWLCAQILCFYQIQEQLSHITL